MNKSFAFFIFAFSFVFAGFSAASASSCSIMDLNRCLDSACGINISLNPGARCQLCGTAQAGSADKNGFRSLSVGASSRNTLSASDLQSAPSDPGSRYAWASGECLKKISGCTADDVSNNYDKLIEQSCRAAGVSAEMNSLVSAANKQKSANVCNSEILLCMNNEKHCGADFSNCKTDEDFNKHFSVCASDTIGCDNFVSDMRTNMISQRDSATLAYDNSVSGIVKSYQTKRESGLKSATDTCTNNKGRESCIKTVCQNNMKNKCDSDSEKSMAILLCKFYDTACGRLK